MTWKVVISKVTPTSFSPYFPLISGLSLSFFLALLILKISKNICSFRNQSHNYKFELFQFVLLALIQEVTVALSSVVGSRAPLLSEVFTYDLLHDIDAFTVGLEEKMQLILYVFFAFSCLGFWLLLRSLIKEIARFVVSWRDYYAILGIMDLVLGAGQTTFSLVINCFWTKTIKTPWNLDLPRLTSLR